MADFDRELDLALQAAAAGAEVLVRMSGTSDVREKDRADLVTAADMESERTIKELIGNAFPADLIMAEESAAPERRFDRRQWIIDPLDGTVNFVHRHPFACVSVGFCDADGPAVGVVHAPFLHEVYHAVRGGGAFLNGEPIRCSEVRVASDALMATGFPFRTGKGDPKTYFELVTDILVTTHGVRRAGAAALDLAYVAAGRVDAFFEIGLSPWDIAAGIVLVEEAGGKVTGWPGDRADVLNSGRILASNGHLHEWLEGETARYAARLGA